MAEKWVYRRFPDQTEQVAERLGLETVTTGILLNRGMGSIKQIQEYLYGGIEFLYDPGLLKDMDRACDLLRKGISGGARIRIIGDYDVDGIMASYILKRGLSELGASPDIRIPDRIRDGYGINVSMIREAERDGVNVIITCDNGISAEEAVREAAARGITMIVTDHHDVSCIPPADAVIDPKRPDDAYPNKNLCGAAVAWKLIRALGGDESLDLLQYAGFATVCDVMDLTGENRIIVKEALARLRTTDNKGLRILAEVCGSNISQTDTYRIGFILGPCLNASGRLDTAMRALDLLEAEDDGQARIIAENLKNLNESRKALTVQAETEAAALIEAEGMQRDRVLVVFLPDVHESIAGIAAGRIREKYSRPVFILTRGRDAVKGSGRSVEAYNMSEELGKVSGFLVKYGGHPMAAGLTIREENIPALREALNRECTLTEEDLVPKICLDAIVRVSDLSEKLVTELQLMEPFGKGNPRPKFGEKNVLCEHPKLFGARSSLLKMRLRSATEQEASAEYGSVIHNVRNRRQTDAICFRDAEALYERVLNDPVISIVYEAEFDEYMGDRRLQAVITGFR